jgi:CRISPR-associated protein Csd1
VSWILKLHDTYEQCVSNLLFQEQQPTLLPVGYSTQQGHIRIVLNDQGKFLRANEFDEKTRLTIPVTEKSLTGRTSGPAPHPLMDKIQYCAKDYPQYGNSKSYFGLYEKQLAAWCTSPNAHPKAKAVLAYVRQGRLVQDLLGAAVLHNAENGPVARLWKTDLKDIFICWTVETPGEPDSDTWTDLSLQNSWIQFDAASREDSSYDLCYVTGIKQQLSDKHPSKIRHPADGAKIISSNDSLGFTFRGKFTDKKGTQAVGVGYEVSQKAHSALRWLIARQGYRNGSQVFVSWAVSGKPIPQPLDDSYDWLDEPAEIADESPAGAREILDNARDQGQSFALRLNNYMRGYWENIDPTEEIVILGMDSATPGRMSIIYNRELSGSEFLNRLECWHRNMSWPQRLTFTEKAEGRKKGKKRVTLKACAPVPRVIAEAAYGRRPDDKLKRATVERLLPCIVEGRPLPRDLVESAVRRAANRPGMEQWEWEQTLGVACALFKGFSALHPNPEQRRAYKMGLDPNCASRDYLYGRLIAIAERIESIALHVAKENRPTTAARLMQRFADRPHSTWRTIELALQPYMQRLQSSRGGFLHNMRELLDHVCGMFQREDFQSERPLSGEFLLGYHCQRLEWNKDKDITSENEGDEE